MSKSRTNSQPFQLALRQATDWVSALRILRATTHVLRGIYTISPAELADAADLGMHTSWSTAVFFAEFARKRELTQLADERYLMNTLLRRSLLTNNTVVATEVFLRYKAAGLVSPIDEMKHFRTFFDWSSALCIASASPELLETHAGVREVLSAAMLGRQWELAMTLLSNHRFLRSDPSPVRKINSMLCRDQRWDLALQVLASSIAEGMHNVNIFIPMMHSLTRQGHWKDALEYALRHGIMDQLRKRTRRTGTRGKDDAQLTTQTTVEPTSLPKRMMGVSTRVSQATASLIFCLSQLDYYPTIDAVAIPQILTSNRNAYYSQGYVRSKIIPPSIVYRDHAEIAKQVDVDFFETITACPHVLFGPVSTFTKAAEGDAVVVLDTNFILWCVTKRLTFENFREEIRLLYPPLRSAPLLSIVCPFRALLESYHVIQRTSPSGISNGLKMLRNFISSNRVVVSSFATELSNNAFYIIQKLWGHNDLYNPDRHILNLVLGFEFEGFAKAKQLGRQDTSAMRVRDSLDLFLMYHAKRVTGNKGGFVDPLLVLCTFDKDMSLRADGFGIMTYPCYAGDSAKSRNQGEL